MKLSQIILILLLLSSCTATQSTETQYRENDKQLITHSLFNDKSATISEESINKILSGNFILPEKMKVAIVRLQPERNNSNMWYYRDENYQKTQQGYIDTLINKLKSTGRVTEAVIVPELLISSTPSFTVLREAAVRMQADALVVYSVVSDVYNKYRIFSKTDVKAFATTQMMMMDVRTGLIPFTTIVTRDTLSKKEQQEADIYETKRRVENLAATMSVEQAALELNNHLYNDKVSGE